MYDGVLHAPKECVCACVLRRADSRLSGLAAKNKRHECVPNIYVYRVVSNEWKSNKEDDTKGKR